MESAGSHSVLPRSTSVPTPVWGRGVANWIESGSAVVDVARGNGEAGPVDHRSFGPGDVGWHATSATNAICPQERRRLDRRWVPDGNDLVMMFA